MRSTGPLRGGGDTAVGGGFGYRRVARGPCSEQTRLTGCVHVLAGALCWRLAQSHLLFSQLHVEGQPPPSRRVKERNTNAR